MEWLNNLGISEDTIKNLIEFYPNLAFVTFEDVIEKQNILKEVGCSDEEFFNIISSNPMVLLITNSGLKELLIYLHKLGFSDISTLIDENPYILTLEIFEIENYLKKRLSNCELLVDIIDDLDSRPYLFNEM